MVFITKPGETQHCHQQRFRLLTKKMFLRVNIIVSRFRLQVLVKFSILVCKVLAFILKTFNIVVHKILVFILTDVVAFNIVYRKSLDFFEIFNQIKHCSSNQFWILTKKSGQIQRYCVQCFRLLNKKISNLSHFCLESFQLLPRNFIHIQHYCS